MQKCLVIGQCWSWSCKFFIMKSFVCIQVKFFFHRFNCFPRICTDKLILHVRWLIRKKYYRRRTFIWRQKSRESFRGLIATNLLQISDCLFVPTFYDFVYYFWLIFDKPCLRKTWGTSCLGGTLIFCSKVFFTNARIIFSLQEVASLYH